MPSTSSSQSQLFPTRQRSCRLRRWFATRWPVHDGAVVVNRRGHVVAIRMAVVTLTVIRPVATADAAAVVVDIIVPIGRHILQRIRLIIHRRCVAALSEIALGSRIWISFRCCMFHFRVASCRSLRWRFC